MSFINNIPRGLRVLVVMAVLGVLIWQFAVDTNYFYYSIGAAVLLTLGTIVLVYKPFKSSKSKESRKKVDSEEGESAGAENTESEPESDIIEIEKDYTDSPSILRNKPGSYPQAKVGKAPSAESRPVNTRPISQARLPDEMETEPVNAEITEGSAKPTIPLVDDDTSLSEEDKNTLVNAVWYRCENPYCKYTSFLGVHHIVDEKAGGTNRLENLIVLCPYCHDLAHRNEIPVEEMKEWISNRETRFKVKPNWKYF